MSPLNPFLKFVAQPPQVDTHLTDQPVTVHDLSKLLVGAGLTWDAFVREIWELPLADAGNLLRYISCGVFRGSGTPEALLFHLRFIRSVSPKDYPIWDDIIRTILEDCPLSETSGSFLQSEGIGLLWRWLLQSVYQEKLSDPDQRKDPRLLVQSLFMFLEIAGRLVADDPNIAVVLDAVNRFGSLQKYYNKHDIPRAAVRMLAAAGYDADYVVFSGQEVMSRGADSSSEHTSHRANWSEEFDQLVTTIVGTEQTPPEIELGVDRFKFLGELAEDRELVRTEQSRPAARRIADRLIPLLRARKSVLERLRLLVPASKLDQDIHRIERHTENAADTTSYSAPAPQRIVARRSTKNVPELFFDDTRLGSWLFKPEGIVHGEICRILLDPAVPMLEIWLEPYTEFMAAIPLYPGFNVARQRCMLVETYHFDDRISDLLGRHDTLNFMLEALLFDAHLAGAEKLAIFAAPWGRSAVFADFIAQLAKQSEHIRYFESYEFESVDPNGSSLKNSLTGSFHYTESLGYNRPMRGTIDFGYNLVGSNAIEKLLSGGRGVFEIDLQAFLGARHLLNSIPQKGTITGTEASFFGSQGERASELAVRIEKKLKQSEGALRRKLPDLQLTTYRKIDTAICAKLLEFHRTAFPEYAFVGPQYYFDRMGQRDAELLVASSGGEMVGIALAFRAEVLPEGAIYIDELAVRADQRQKGIGVALVETVLRVAAVRGRREAYLLTRFDPPGSPLMKFYEQLRFRVEGDYPDTGRLFRRPLSLFGSENRDEVDGVLSKLRSRLASRIPDVVVECVTGVTPGLIATMETLEMVFPEDIRYSPTEFADRMSFRDAFALVISKAGSPIAFTLCYHDPILPDHVMFGDVLAVKPEWQNKRIGVELMNAVLRIPALTNYTDLLLYCTERTQDGKSLVQYYRYFGGRVVDVADKVRMLIPLRLRDSESRRPYRDGGSADNESGSAARALDLSIRSAQIRRSRRSIVGERSSPRRATAVGRHRGSPTGNAD